MARTTRGKLGAGLLEAFGDLRYTRFVRIYERTCAALGAVPPEAGDEILNAFDHFVKARKAKSETEETRHITNGHAHVLQATLICLALAVKDRIEVAGNYIEAIEDHISGTNLISVGGSLVTFRTALSGLRAQRNILIPQVGPIRVGGLRKPTGDVVALETLYKELNALLTKSNGLLNTVGENSILVSIFKARAKLIWLREGKPRGKDKEHWIKAQQEIGQPNRLSVDPSIF